MSKTLSKAVVEGLYRRYWFQVEQRCSRLLANAEEGRDAAQEVFVRLITHGGEFRADAEWMTWLYRVATNVCLNRMRNRKRRGDEWKGAVSREAFSEVKDPERLLFERAVLVRVLEDMDETAQKIGVHYFIDEMTQEEIGALLELSRVTINKKLKVLKERAEVLIREELS